MLGNVTILGSQREMTVICIAPERNWAILQPAFQHMISQRGSRQRVIAPD